MARSSPKGGVNLLGYGVSCFVSFYVGAASVMNTHAATTTSFASTDGPIIVSEFFIICSRGRHAKAMVLREFKKFRIQVDICYSVLILRKRFLVFAALQS